VRPGHAADHSPPSTCSAAVMEE